MAQLPPRTCPQCHAPVLAGLRFCRNCGANADSGIGRPPATALDGVGYAQYPNIPVQQPTPQPFSHPGYPAQVSRLFTGAAGLSATASVCAVSEGFYEKCPS